MRQQIRTLRDLRREDSGFTLIELLVAVIILGVLAAIVVFAVGQFNNDGVQAACKADIKNTEIAAEAMYAKTGTAPTTLTGLVTAGYLKEEPPSSATAGTSHKYEVALSTVAATATTPAVITVTGTLGAAGTGASCTA
jgi:prepilin-type N-terminal cleavage/methylation domain-containing protein